MYHNLLFSGHGVGLVKGGLNPFSYLVYAHLNAYKLHYQSRHVNGMPSSLMLASPGRELLQTDDVAEIKVLSRREKNKNFNVIVVNVKIVKVLLNISNGTYNTHRHLKSATDENALAFLAFRHSVLY